MAKIRMKISERFALSEYLRTYPSDKTYAEILEMINNNDPKISAFGLFEDHPEESLIALIETTRKKFEQATDDLVYGVALHDVREGDLDRPKPFTITSRRVYTYTVQAVDEEDAIDKHNNGESTLLNKRVMELTAEGSEA